MYYFFLADRMLRKKSARLCSIGMELMPRAFHWQFFPISPTREPGMIRLTRLNQTELIINSDLIEHVEIGGDTVVKLTDGNSFVVMESPDEIIERVVRFKKRILDITKNSGSAEV